VAKFRVVLKSREKNCPLLLEVTKHIDLRVPLFFWDWENLVGAAVAVVVGVAVAVVGGSMVDGVKYARVF